MISRVSVGVGGGADPFVQPTVYRGFTRTILEWGVVFFLGASKAVLRVLNRVQYGSLRFRPGCMCLTPITVLQSEANELPLNLCKSLLANRFMMRNLLRRNKPFTKKLKFLSEKAQ